MVPIEKADLKIELINKNKEELTAKIGPCWPFLILGFLVSLYRKDYLNFLVGLISGGILLALIRYLPLIGMASFIIWRLYWFLNYNKIYLKDLLEKGYKAKNKKDLEIVKKYIS